MSVESRREDDSWESLERKNGLGQAIFVPSRPRSDFCASRRISQSAARIRPGTVICRISQQRARVSDPGWQRAQPREIRESESGRRVWQAIRNGGSDCETRAFRGGGWDQEEAGGGMRDPDPEL